MNLSASEQLSYSTARIECEYSNGSLGTGSGFFFRFLENENNGMHIPVIITNKHVIQGAAKGRIIITKSASKNKPLDTEHFRVSFDNFERLWKGHEDPNVDLCAMPIAPLIKEAEKQGEKLFFVSLSKSLLPTQEQMKEFTALEEIIMVGYPNGIWDHINNKPIFRKGVTATHLKLDYNGKRSL